MAVELQMLTSNLSAGCQGSGLEPQASERMEMFLHVLASFKKKYVIYLAVWVLLAARRI